MSSAMFYNHGGVFAVIWFFLISSSDTWHCKKYMYCCCKLGPRTIFTWGAQIIKKSENRRLFKFLLNKSPILEGARAPSVPRPLVVRMWNNYYQIVNILFLHNITYFHFLSPNCNQWLDGFDSHLSRGRLGFETNTY